MKKKKPNEKKQEEVERKIRMESTKEEIVEKTKGRVEREVDRRKVVTTSVFSSE